MLKTVDRKSSKSADRQIREMLLSQISKGNEGTKLPTEQEMCKRFGVSRMTVNKVISKLASEGYLYRIRSKGTFVKKSREGCKSIKFLLPGPGSLSDQRHKPLQLCLSGAVNETHRLGMRIDTIMTTHDHMSESIRPEMFKNIKPDDNVFIFTQWWHPVFPVLADSGCNVVYVNKQFQNPEFDNYFRKWFVLTIDTVGAVEDIVNYLFINGRQKTLCFHISSEFTCPDPRTRGFLNGIERNGLSVNPVLMPEVFFNIYQNSDYLISIIKETYKKEPFDSIICPPSFSKYVLKALSAMQLKVPDDVAVIATADADSLNDLPVPVSTLATPYNTLGIEMVKCFNRDVFMPGEKIFRPTLIERESSCKGAGNKINPYMETVVKNSPKDNSFYI